MLNFCYVYNHFPLVILCLLASSFLFFLNIMEGSTSLTNLFKEVFDLSSLCCIVFVVLLFHWFIFLFIIRFSQVYYLPLILLQLKVNNTINNIITTFIMPLLLPLLMFWGEFAFFLTSFRLSCFLRNLV